MILDFSKINKDDVATVGGKAANLGEMISAGFHVPRGFVITTAVYNQFLKDNHLDIMICNKLVECENEKDVLNIVSDFREKIYQGEFSDSIKNDIRDAYEKLGIFSGVAVRSSATAEDLEDASFAGQQETYLNVRGLDEVLLKVKACFASLWSDRAVSYRYHNKYYQEVSIAVVIQEMVESEKSGVLFTVNPLNKNENEMQINSSFGLGESVVSGKVTADSFIVDKKGNILESYIARKERKIIYEEHGTAEVDIPYDVKDKPSLNNTEIKRLAEVAVAIEEHYKMPMDIEFGIKDQEIYILQARAITTLQKKKQVSKDLVNEYIKNITIKKRDREMMSFLIEKIPVALKAFEFDFLEVIDQQKKILFEEIGLDMPSNLTMDRDAIMTLSKSYKHLNHNIIHIFSTLKTLRNLSYQVEKCKEFIPYYQKKIDAFSLLDFDHMSLLECKDFISESYHFLEELAYKRFKYALFPMVFNTRKFKKIVTRVNEKYTSFDLFWDLNNKTAVVTKDMMELAEKIKTDDVLKEKILSRSSYHKLINDFPEFKKLIYEFLDKHGFKSDFNVCLIEGKSFHEQPERLIDILIPLLDDNMNTSSSHDFKELMERIKKVYGRKYECIEKEIEDFRYLHFVREESQYLWESLFYYVRQCLKRANMLLLHHKDYKNGLANLFYDELLIVLEEGSLSDEYREKIEKRIDNYPLSSAVWEETKLLLFDFKSDILEGVSGSAGTVVGNARIILKTSDFYKMKKGDILVCHYTDPEWTPLFQLASAVVADTGSALSHAAIVAREFNIPAVLGVGFATSKFKDGDIIRVDGDKGEVKGV